MKIIRKKGAGRIRIVEHNRTLFYVILALIALLFAVICLLVNQGKKLIGGDKDEHDCLTAAGYSWNETKQKCVREWEEKDKNFCTPEQRTAQVCPSFWEPVCGNAFEISQKPKTFSNSCIACMYDSVDYWIKGECSELQ
jgi:hypothetical protein